MAVIEKLRSKASLLIGIVAFSLLAFILGDFLTSNKSMFSGNGNTVGVIGGKKIDVQGFEKDVQTEIENYKLSQNKETVDNNTTDQIRDQAWNKLVNDIVMGSQYKSLGINVSTDELADMVKGKNIHPQIRQAFTDPKTGVFNPATVINFLKNMDNDPTGKTKRQWLNFEKAIYEERLQAKYNDLVKQGLYVSTPEAKMEYENRNRNASIKFVTINYNTIPDTTIQVSDEDLKTVYNRNIKKYKQEASRSIDYVTFEVIPSQADMQASLANIAKLAADFRTSDDDTAFVVANSDEAMDNSFHKKGSLDPQIDSVIFDAPIGTVIGPYSTGSSFRLAKLTDSRILPDSVQARHILIPVEGGNKDAAMAKADSLKKVIEAGGNFAQLAMQFSSDQGSKIKGGDLGYFAQGMMVPSFNDACFQGKVGDRPIVESQFGIHLIEITGQKGGTKQVKVATVIQNTQPSSKTYQEYFQKANDFANKYNTNDAFDKGVKEANQTKQTENNVMESTRQIGGIENSRELVRWAFNNEKGTVSKAFEFGNKFVIARLNEVREKGTATMEQKKDELLVEARRDKKAEMLIDKINKTGSATNLDALAGKLGVQVMTAENFNFTSPYLASAGYEPYVTGYVTTLKAGTVSKPVKGQSGVYVVMVNSFTEPAAAKDFKDIKTQMTQQYQQRSQYEVLNALREKADIQDNRGKFY
ncbi:MAG: SurA N-terminal domain-containing protein [Bacteroidota bacterium]